MEKGKLIPHEDLALPFLDRTIVHDEMYGHILGSVDVGGKENSNESMLLPCIPNGPNLARNLNGIFAGQFIG